MVTLAINGSTQLTNWNFSMQVRSRPRWPVNWRLTSLSRLDCGKKRDDPCARSAKRKNRQIRWSVGVTNGVRGAFIKSRLVIVTFPCPRSISAAARDVFVSTIFFISRPSILKIWKLRAQWQNFYILSCSKLQNRITVKAMKFITIHSIYSSMEVW